MVSSSCRITGDPQKVEYAKQLVYELIAEKEMQMFHRGGGRGTERTGNYSNDTGFNHGPANSDGVEVNNYFYYVQKRRKREKKKEENKYIFLPLKFIKLSFNVGACSKSRSWCRYW